MKLDEDAQFVEERDIQMGSNQKINSVAIEKT